MAMVGVYYGYNMMQLCNDYNHRIRSLEDKVEALENGEELTHSVTTYLYVESCEVIDVPSSFLKAPGD